MQCFLNFGCILATLTQLELYTMPSLLPEILNCPEGDLASVCVFGGGFFAFPNDFNIPLG